MLVRSRTNKVLGFVCADLGVKIEDGLRCLLFEQEVWVGVQLLRRYDLPFHAKCY